MAAVSIDSGPVEAEDRLQDVPKEKWRDLLLARRTFLEIRLPHDCRCLVQFVAEAQEMYAALGYESVEAMVRSGYGLSPDDVAIAVGWLHRNKPHEPIPFAVTLRKTRGRPGKGNNITFSPEKRETSREYTVARLERDGDTLEKVSPNAAAVRAGWRNPTVPVRTDDMASAARTLRRKLSRDQCRQLAEALLSD